MKIPFLALIFQGIPESIAIVTLAFVISKIPIEWKKIIPMGVMIALVSYVLRLLPLTFGIHTVILLGLLFFFLIRIGKGSVNSSLIASLLSYLAIIITETVCLSILMPLFGVTSELLFNNTGIRILITWPQVVILFIAAFLVHKISRPKTVN